MVEEERSGLMCITLLFHGVSARPSKGHAVRVGIFMSLARGRASHKRVGKTCMGHTFVPEQAVTGREESGQSWVQAFSDTTLGRFGQGPFWLCAVIYTSALIGS